MGGLNKLIYASPALITAGLIFTVSSMENIELPMSSVSFNDLLFHGAGYFVFGLTLLLAARPWKGLRENPLRACSLLVAIGMLYAFSDEIHQGFVPNRTCSFADFAADSFGVILAVVGRHALKKSARQSRN